jgi:hypothetical protein
MLITPAEGIKVGEFNFHMPTFSEMFSTENEDYTDVTEIILEHQFDIDSIADLEVEMKRFNRCRQL